MDASLTIVKTSVIADSAITTAKIADSNVTTAKIADANVTSAKLATSSNERDWVLARTAATGVGAVGTYALLQEGSTGTSALSPGATMPGSSLQYTGTHISSGNFLGGSSPSGTWRIMGQRLSSGSPLQFVSVWLRIS